MRPVLSLLLLGAWAADAQDRCITGRVEDASGASVSRAFIAVRTAQGATVGVSSASAEGEFSFCGLPPGAYQISASHAGFAPTEVSVRAGESVNPVRVTLEVISPRSAVTVTASRGSVEDLAGVSQMASAANREEVRRGAPVNLGGALQGKPGILVQETTYGQVSPYLRGLTGYQTLMMVDGIRFNTSTFRSGPNQYLGYIQPGQVDRVEAVLGPAGALYGSDAMGGAVQVITMNPRFGSGSRLELHGDASATAGSADGSAGANAEVSVGNQSLSMLLGFNHRSIGDLRAGGGDDSRNAFRRYFGLDSTQVRNLLGDRLQGTSLQQNGAFGKLAWRPSELQSVSLWYQWSDLDGVQSYRDQLGGPGRLLARVEPQGLNFAYARMERLRVGPLDSLSGTFSINSQRDGTVRQALRPTDVITTDRSRVDSLGYAAQASTHAGGWLALVFGGEAYDERIGSTRFTADPVRATTIQERALFPNGSRYLTAAGFAQATVEIAPRRLRANAGMRFTRVGFTTSADSNRDGAGRPLGVSDTSRGFRDVTYSASLTWQIGRGWGASVMTGRGFRAPNLTDLGAVGLMTALGFDIPAEDVLGTGALIGADSGEGAASTGRPVRSLRAESLYNNEAGVFYGGKRFYARVHVFNADLANPIVARTLLFPVSRIPQQLAGLPLTPIAQSPAQAAQGVTAVATPLSSRGVKASVNDGSSRYYGMESVLQYRISSRWSGEANYSFLAGRDLNPNRPARRLPPQMGKAELRYTPAGRRPWASVALRFAGQQSRLAGGDLDDDRMGASRRRTDIADFFRGGVASSHIQDGRLIVTGETLREIQDRVLPLGAVINGIRVANDGTRVPLYTATSGWYSFDLQGGFPLTERVHAQFGALNILDRNYRIHGSGIDAPGINLYAGIRYTF